MQIGDVVLMNRGAKIHLPSGLEVTAAHTVAIRVGGLILKSEPCKCFECHGRGKADVLDRISWTEDNMEKSVHVRDVRKLPCCWIIGEGSNRPMAGYEAIKKPLAQLGVEVLYIPMSRVTGLYNFPADKDPIRFSRDVWTAVENARKTAGIC